MNFLAGFTEELQRNTDRVIDLKELVVKTFASDAAGKSALSELFQVYIIQPSSQGMAASGSNEKLDAVVVDSDRSGALERSHRSRVSSGNRSNRGLGRQALTDGKPPGGLACGSFGLSRGSAIKPLKRKSAALTRIALCRCAGARSWRS